MTTQICHVSGKIFIRKMWSKIFTFRQKKRELCCFYSKETNALLFLQQLKRGKKKSLSVAHFIYTLLGFCKKELFSFYEREI